MGYDMETVENRNYFRLNIWGMGEARTVMDQIPGMLVADYNMPKFKWDKKYHVSRNLRWKPEGTTGIAVHKLSSNDGWIVTPEECQEAVTAYDKADTSDMEIPEWFDGWVDYLRSGIHEQGIEVW